MSWGKRNNYATKASICLLNSTENGASDTAITHHDFLHVRATTVNTILPATTDESAQGLPEARRTILSVCHISKKPYPRIEKINIC